MKETYKLTKSETLSALRAEEGGLTSAEAERRRAKFGKNILKEGKKRSLPALFFAQFKDLMTVILICAAVLSGTIAYLTRNVSEIADTGILLFIILLNAVVGFIQQYRADSAVEKLKKLSKATAKAVRDGKVAEIDAAELVPGDVVELEEGDRVPADCRVLEGENFRCDESALTGESRPVKKQDCVVASAALADRANTAHMGTFCVSGHARCLVVNTGMETEMGAIADLLHASAPALSPLDRTVAKLGKIITVTVFAVAAVLFFGGLLAGRTGVLENFMTAVAVAVAAIPEGMGAAVTIILAMGVQRMSRKKAVMRRLSAVETLGSCTCICSDKTGTLTMNRMTVSGVKTDFAEGDPAAVKNRLLACIRVCNTVKGSPGAYLGDPTEIALVEYADRVGYTLSFRPLGSIPFSSERKRMSVAAEAGGKKKLFVKGGSEVVLKRCTRIAVGEGDRIMTEGERIAIEAAADGFASEAMRVLAFAEGVNRNRLTGEGESGSVNQKRLTEESAGGMAEEDLVFLGLVAFFDPPKAGAKAAVEACGRAGVRTVMITGDSAETAFGIATRLGIATRRREVLTGEEIDSMKDFPARADRFSVFARVSPKHKLLIVKALQGKGEIVAMTGDGVNDAPSVKAADIGVAMGSGTDVTKNAADMIIADDDFSTMVGAVEEGRNVFCNIKRMISFFLSTNLAEVLAVLFSTLLLWRYEFLTSTQLLWINLITDSLPVLALGVERTAGVMERPPVSAKEIFGGKNLRFMLFFGVVQAAIVLGLFAYGAAWWGNAAASTCAFLTLSLLELFHAFNVRKETGRTTFREFVADKTLLLTVGIGIVLNVLLVAVPLFAGAFGLVALGLTQWLAVACCSLAIVPIGELYKAFAALPERRKARRKKLARPA